MFPPVGDVNSARGDLPEAGAAEAVERLRSCGIAADAAHGTGLAALGKEELQGVVAELPDGVEVVLAALLHVVGEIVSITFYNNVRRNEARLNHILFLFYFITFHDNHRAAGDFLHFPLYLVPGITALEVGGEREASIALHVNHTDSDAVFLLAFQNDRLRWADVELFPIVGWRDSQEIGRAHV